MSALKSLLEAIQELLFPACCLGCERQLVHYRLPLLCEDCSARVSTIAYPLCTCCGTPFLSGENHLCVGCLRSPFAFSKARSIFFYQEPVSSLLLRLKFGGTLTGLASLAELTHQSRADLLFKEPDLVLPVPLHISRLRSRGFNQSLLLAQACFPRWKDKIRVNLLLRHQPTTPQTRLSGQARRNNLQGAFGIHKANELTGKNILLIDDVFTTGSTLQECSRVLAKAGAAEIEAFTLARAL